MKTLMKPWRSCPVPQESVNGPISRRSRNKLHAAGFVFSMEMMAMSLTVRAQVRTVRSEPALVELYGELGRWGVSSVKRARSSRARSP